MKYFGAIIGLVVVVGAVFVFLSPTFEDSEIASADKQYTSSSFGISFSYPTRYFEYATDHEGERLQHTVALLEDTQENRDLVEGRMPGREGPPTITVAMYQNNLDNYTAEKFIRDTSYSNFKLSDGTLIPTTVGGEAAMRYRASGLYENENVVVARPDFVYMFTVNYLSAQDEMIRDFDELLSTVIFNDTMPIVTSADNAPPGSIHNLPVPPAVSAVKKHAAEKFGVSEDLVKVMTAYEKEWSDSCLGLGGPAESCLRAKTSGWEVTVSAKGTETIFRTNADGSEIRSEK